MAGETQTTPAGPGTAPPVAPGSPPNQPPVAPAGLSAAASAPRFGGLRGGKPRADGLVPGSPEAAEADRKKDAARKASSRARPKSEPPPLPSASASPGNSTQAPPPGMSGGPGPEAASFLAWQPDMLKPLFAQLIPATEEMMVAQLAGKAQKGKLPVDLVKEIEADAHWKPPVKVALEMSAPEVAAKWMNEAGISAEHRFEVVLGTAVAQLAIRHLQLLRKLDELITRSNQAADKKEEKKP